MATETTKLTIRLPVEHAAFAEAYAREHDISVIERIDRFGNFADKPIWPLCSSWARWHYMA